MLFVERMYMAVVILCVKALGTKRYTKYISEAMKEDLELHQNHPIVLVQIPMYNEKEVYKPPIGAACRLSWPSHHLILQILDDSAKEVLRGLLVLGGFKGLMLLVDRKIEPQWKTDLAARASLEGWKFVFVGEVAISFPKVNPVPALFTLDGF